ncbi:MAG: N-acetylmuramoyl-L-alanine amidase [Streptococcus sp.]|nr:N-acetylmuramoyl-L-alanine amidase [Streptococcus sp.]
MQTWYESSGNWTSAHYEIADNEIWGCVGEQYSAFHSGDATMNRRSIGIEHLNATGAPHWTISEATYKSSAKLIADICKRYNIPIDAKHIIPHKQVSATECPGGIDMAKLIRMAQEVSRGGVFAKNTTTQKTSGSFRVRVSVSDLNIRKSPSLKAGKNGVVKPGVYTITETKSADGYEWGKLKSGAGWIALKYTSKL